MRYVFVTDELPRPGSAGHLATNHAIISWLQELGHYVTVLLLGTRLAWPMERYGIAPVVGPQVSGMPAMPRPPPAGWQRRPNRLVFVGSAALPNLDGLRWFLSDIWPRLGRHIQLDLIGDCGAALGSLPSGVTRHGRVQDLRRLLHDSSLAISPLRVGSGLKVKLLEYARHGLVTIATPCSLEGFMADESAPFVAASSPEDFAASILLQLAAPARPDTAIAYVKRHYGIEACFGALRAALGA